MKIQHILSLLPKLTALGALTFATSYASVAEQATESQNPSNRIQLPSFTAVYRYLHEPTETVLDSARVSVSEAGLRVDQLTDDSGNALIANFESAQMWFLNSQRGLVHEVPISAIDPNEKFGVVPVEGLLPGFIQFQPCGGMRAVFSENMILRGHALTRWQCLSNSDEQLLEQLFSTNLGVVLWSKDTDGFISELVDVRMSTPNPGIFKPPSHYREVEISELINGSPSIDIYTEGDLDIQ